MSPSGGRLRDLAVLGLAVAGLSVPFADKPFHIDDDVYLKGAEQILRDPLRPLAGTQRLLGEEMPAHHFTQHPPLVSYALAALVARFGEQERPLHLAFVAFALLAAFAGYAVACRFTPHPLATSLLLVVTPAFTVASHSLMTDVPFLAFFLSAAAAFVWGLDRDRPGLLALGALALALACAVQYRGLLLVPLLLGYAWLSGGRLPRAAAACVPALGAAAAWSLYNLQTLGTIHLLDAGSWLELQPGRMGRDALAYVSFLGGAGVCPAALLLVARHHPGGGLGSRVAIPAAGLATALGMAPGYALPERALLAVFVSAGLWMLWRAPRWAALASRVWLRPGAAAGTAEADDAFLALMVAVPLLSQVVLNLFASVRSLLIALPFLLVALMRRVAAHRLPGAIAVAIALTGANAVAVAIADREYARAAREVAQSAAGRPPAGARRWLTGEWGFRHYGERAGLRAVTADGAGVAGGDLLAVPDVAVPAALDPRFVERLRLVETIESPRRFPLKTMSFEAHAGFYSDFHGLLPWSFSRGPLERVRLFRVGPAATAGGRR